MISELFLDTCLNGLCNIKNQPNSVDLFKSMNQIITDYESNMSKDDQPVEFKDKVDLIKWLCDYRIKNTDKSEDVFSIDHVMSLLENMKLKNIIQTLPDREQELTETVIVISCAALMLMVPF